MLETSGNAKHWTGAGCVLTLDVKLYIYSLPGFECKEGVKVCPRL
jgi:hypothetical protein